MGLISKTVKVKWHPRNKDYYEALGYIYTKMGDEFEVKVEDLTKGSKVNIKYICDFCKEVKTTSYQHYNKCRKGKLYYCFNCGNKIYGVKNSNKTKLSKSKSFYDWCIENNRQDILDRWDCELNDCSPRDISYCAKKKMWFKCNEHPEHKSELKSIQHFTSGQEGSIECKQCNSMGQYIIDNYGEEFLWSVWSDKNIISPFEIAPRSNKKVWWNCPDSKHESFERSCDSSVRYEFRCPDCVKEREESILEEKTKIYLEQLGYEVFTEYYCSLTPINPKTKRPLPFDNEIVLENEKHLIIEVHGEQHYDTHLYETRYNYTKDKAKYKLHERKLYDRYKRIKCIQVGYEYLEIPYTAFDKKDSYKKLINNKIKEIVKNK